MCGRRLRARTTTGGYRVVTPEPLATRPDTIVCQVCAHGEAYPTQQEHHCKRGQKPVSPPHSCTRGDRPLGETDSTSSGVCCGICEEAPASLFCSECKPNLRVMCAGCHASSHRSEKKRNHNITNIEQQQQQPGVRLRPVLSLNTTDDAKVARAKSDEVLRLQQEYKSVGTRPSAILVGTRVDVLWHGEGYTATVRSIDPTTGRVSVCFDLDGSVGTDLTAAVHGLKPTPTVKIKPGPLPPGRGGQLRTSLHRVEKNVTAQPNKNGQYSCTYCDAPFTTSYLLAEHVRKDCAVLFAWEKKLVPLLLPQQQQNQQRGIGRLSEHNGKRAEHMSPEPALGLRTVILP